MHTSLTPPSLLAPNFKLNSIGFARKSIATTIDAGAGLVIDAITDLKRDLADFRKDQRENNSMIQRQVAAIHANMEKQTDAITFTSNRLRQRGLSLLASCDNNVIEGRISLIDNSLSFENLCLRWTDDPAEIITIKSCILALKNERRE